MGHLGLVRFQLSAATATSAVWAGMWFLAWAQLHRAIDTYDDYRDWLNKWVMNPTRVGGRVRGS